ncbi:MAG TPA: hypothetical protein VGD78_13840 [Chthoniobacterales bacterium]
MRICKKVFFALTVICSRVFASRMVRHFMAVRMTGALKGALEDKLPYRGHHPIPRSARDRRPYRPRYPVTPILRYLLPALALCLQEAGAADMEPEAALRSAENRLIQRLWQMPFYLTTARPRGSPEGAQGGYGPWREQVVATVFWVGEPASLRNPVSNKASAWDPVWRQTFGGVDDPKERVGMFPARFLPRRNPFYVALPFNDRVDDPNRPPLNQLVPWSVREPLRPGADSVCQGAWIAVRNAAGISCYAQWEDVGPFATDHWQYVFGQERPRPNRNGGAGIDLSPSVRDYLGLNGLDVVDWKFVRKEAVPPGPWLCYGRDGTTLNVPLVVSALRDVLRQ